MTRLFKVRYWEKVPTMLPMRGYENELYVWAQSLDAISSKIPDSEIRFANQNEIDVHGETAYKINELVKKGG